MLSLFASGVHLSAAALAPTTVLGFAFIGLVALLAGVTAAVLSWQAGAHWANAVLRGAAAFGGTVTLEILLIKALGF
ncbi:hypothetical protein [Streptomyces sp. NPDC003401]